MKSIVAWDLKLTHFNTTQTPKMFLSAISNPVTVGRNKGFATNSDLNTFSRTAYNLHNGSYF